MNESPSHHADLIAICIGPLLIVMLSAWFASWTGPDQDSGAVVAGWVFLTAAPLSVLWIVSAAGLGWLVRLALLREAKEGLAIQLGLGVAVMLVLDEALGTLGAFQLGGNAGAWTMACAGAALAMIQFVRWVSRKPAKEPLAPPYWLFWTAAPSIAVLLVAACSAPGLLWASEFGGYDALSYHLQLPIEWMARGRVEPLNHNIYSYLPGYVEAAYYHVMVLRGNAIEALYACQLLHAAITLLAATLTYRLASRIGGRVAGAVAAVILLATPWVIVVGSLAYNEMAVSLLLLAGMLVIAEDEVGPRRRGAAIGLLAGAACGAKLTAAGMVGLPLAALLMMRDPRRFFVGACAAATVGLIALAPYLLRNLAYSANPVFPFATGMFGLVHWTNEQAQIWTRGHMSDASALQRIVELWHQFLRFGLGENPVPHEPWKPQWSLVPMSAVVALGLTLLWPVQRGRRWALMLGIVIALQVLFWLTFTHLKSRFLLPAAAPMALVIASAVTWLRMASALVKTTLLALILLAASAAPVFVYRGEAGGAPASWIGLAPHLTGDQLTSPMRQEAGSSVSAAIAINHLLPDDAQVLMIGHATPLYFRQERIIYQTTWDRGALSTLMREHPDDPTAWGRALREQGFTHLLIDQTMLRIWERSRWNDPLLTVDRVTALARQAGRPLYEYPNGLTLHELTR